MEIWGDLLLRLDPGHRLPRLQLVLDLPLEQTVRRRKSRLPPWLEFLEVFYLRGEFPLRWNKAGQSFWWFTGQKRLVFCQFDGIIVGKSCPASVRYISYKFPVRFRIKSSERVGIECKKKALLEKPSVSPPLEHRYVSTRTSHQFMNANVEIIWRYKETEECCPRIRENLEVPCTNQSGIVLV